MLEDLSKDLWNVALAGIGAIAIAGEKLTEFGKVCAEKGGEALEKGKALNEECKRRGEQMAQERREKCRQEALQRLTAQEREELRQKLAELDAQEAEAARIAAEEAAKAEADAKVIDFTADKKDED